MIEEEQKYIDNFCIRRRYSPSRGKFIIEVFAKYIGNRWMDGVELGKTAFGRHFDKTIFDTLEEVDYCFVEVCELVEKYSLLKNEKENR